MATKNINDVAAENYASYTTPGLLKSPRLGRTMAYWCGGIFLMLCLLLFLPWTQNIRSNGTLTAINPAERPQTLPSIISGRIENWHVQEGELVQKGDTIISLSEVKDKYFDPNLLARMNEQIAAKEGTMQATEEKEKALDEQIKALRAGLDFSLDKGRNKVLQMVFKLRSDSADLVAGQNEFKIAQQQLERQENLYRQGLKSLTELETRRLKFQETLAKLQVYDNKYRSTQNELVNARIELSSLQSEYREKIAKAESEKSATRSYVYGTAGEISKMQSEYASTKIRSSFYHITAPQDGYVVKALKAGIGETIKEGEAIVSIMPGNTNLAVELYVKPMDIPLLRIGQPVRLQFDGWPTLVFSGWPGASFGTFAGTIAVIDNIATEGKYRILVVPDKKDEPWPTALRVGSGVYGWALLHNVPIWYELWRQLNGFPADYVGDGPAPAKESKGKSEESKTTEQVEY